MILAMVYARPNNQHPATEEALKKLSTIPYKKSMDFEANDPCVICSEEFVENEPAIYLNCGSRHIFHEQCIKTWIQINAICPICRHPIE